MSRFLISVCLLAELACAASAQTGRRVAPKPSSLEPIAAWLRHKEAVEMLTSILRGDMKGSGSAWFHPGQSVYSWRWLAQHYDANHDGAIQLKEWPGPRSPFERLDRNHDGRLSAEDLDWSDDAPLNRQMEVADRLFGRADRDEDDSVSAEEWHKLFEQAAGRKKTLSRQQLHALLFPPPPPGRPRMSIPSQATLLRGLLSAEVGSPLEGPSVGQAAPEIALPTHDGTRLIRLRDYRGHKPVVLIFGSFT